jgi:molybdopterin-guanine dinucleotide biosynthesis protein A
VLAPRDRATGKWQPLFARYAPLEVRPALAAALAASERWFQALLARVSCSELSLSAEEHAQLRDWDLPSDVEP